MGISTMDNILTMTPSAGEPIFEVFLADDATYSFTDKSAGFASIQLGDTNNYRAIFWRDTSGNIVMLDFGGDAYVKKTDTNGYLCIYKSGTQVIIKNRTGSDQTLKFF